MSKEPHKLVSHCNTMPNAQKTKQYKLIMSFLISATSRKEQVQERMNKSSFALSSKPRWQKKPIPHWTSSKNHQHFGGSNKSNDTSHYIIKQGTNMLSIWHIQYSIPKQLYKNWLPLLHINSFIQQINIIILYHQHSITSKSNPPAKKQGCSSA